MNGTIIPKADRWLLIGLGASSMATQIVMLREFLTVFSGNELVVGLLLASWMALTGFGAWIVRYTRSAVRPPISPETLLLLLALLPPISVLLLRVLRNLAFAPGVVLGFGSTVGTTLVLLLPYCLVSGGTFTLLAGRSSPAGTSRTGGAYGWEALGGGIAGAVVSILLVPFIRTIALLLILCALISTLVFCFSRRRTRWFSGGIVLVSLAAGLLLPVDDWSKGFLFPGQQILENRDTPYSNLVVTRQEGQLNFYGDGVLLFSTDDVVQNEESVHFSMLQRRDISRVLLISGGVSGRIPELLKYPSAAIDYLEFDPVMLGLGAMYGPDLTQPRVRTIGEDPRTYVRRRNARYGAVFVNLPDPSTALLNRVYTDEFFRDVKALLEPDGIFALSLLEDVEYRGTESRSLISVLVNTLRRHFGHVLIVPGSRDYILSSDAPLRIDITALVRERGVQTRYVNDAYLDDGMLRERSNLLMSEIDGTAGINTDFAPVSYFRYVQYWLRSMGSEARWIGGAVLLLAALLIVILPPVPLGMLSAGYAASSLEVLLLLAFQALFGHFYQLAGLLIALFMSGLAAGALLLHQHRDANAKRAFLISLGAIGLMAVIAPLTFQLARATASAPSFSLMLFLLFMPLIGSATGAAFSAAAEMTVRRPREATMLYSADLAGAALGAAVTATCLVPLLGILNTSYLTCLLVVAGGAAVAVRLRTSSEEVHHHG